MGWGGGDLRLWGKGTKTESEVEEAGERGKSRKVTEKEGQGVKE